MSKILDIFSFSETPTTLQEEEIWVWVAKDYFQIH